MQAPERRSAGAGVATATSPKTREAGSVARTRPRCVCYLTEHVPSRMTSTARVTRRSRAILYCGLGVGDSHRHGREAVAVVCRPVELGDCRRDRRGPRVPHVGMG